MWRARTGNKWGTHTGGFYHIVVCDHSHSVCLRPLPGTPLSRAGIEQYGALVTETLFQSIPETGGIHSLYPESWPVAHTLLFQEASTNHPWHQGMIRWIFPHKRPELSSSLLYYFSFFFFFNNYEGSGMTSRKEMWGVPESFRPQTSY